MSAAQPGQLPTHTDTLKALPWECGHCLPAEPPVPLATQVGTAELGCQTISKPPPMWLRVLLFILIPGCYQHTQQRTGCSQFQRLLGTVAAWRAAWAGGASADLSLVSLGLTDMLTPGALEPVKG